MRALNVIETAYRAVIEEQDDTIVWLTHAMRGAGADLAVLLRGAAVNYVVRGQNAARLRFGDLTQRRPPTIPDDVAGLIAKGVPVYVVQEDLDELGLRREEIIDGPELVRRADLPDLFERYDTVWHW